jgi:glycosyltransferase involved in cell wall biosynthesis
MRLCLVYDHLFPQTVGGAERWMRDLALGAAEAGHEVTYLTMRHWERGASPELTGVRVLGLIEPGTVYAQERRTLGPPLRFGLAVARHLAAHGKTYDVVHTASFPYFPVLSAALLRRRSGYRLFVDWHEAWSRGYWQRYAGSAVGTVGWLVQKACVRVRHTAFCMSQLQARELVKQGYDGTPIVLPGLYAGTVEPTTSAEVQPDLVAYAGRHVREKRIDALVRGFAHARASQPGLELELFGDGPDRLRIEGLVRELGLEACVQMAGKVSEGELDLGLARAACLATASEREGYGLVVVEAAAHGTPSVIVGGPENAALELVHEGVNGAIAPSPAPRDIGDAILRVVEAGAELRDSTASWFAENAPSLRIERSLELVLSRYEASGVP